MATHGGTDWRASLLLALLLLLEVQTGRTSCLTDGAHVDRDPSWSPDGQWLRNPLQATPLVPADPSAITPSPALTGRAPLS